jgi:hypothetical protein
MIYREVHLKSQIAHGSLASEQEDMEDEYRRMAGDAEHEREAAEWSEALSGDAIE